MRNSAITNIFFVAATLVGLVLGTYIILVSFPHERSVDKNSAIEAVIEAYPKLAAYQTTSLPPSSIEAKENDHGFDIGFIQSGSGVPGVLNAQCYHVTQKREVTLIGAYAGSTTTAQSVDLSNCKPFYTRTASTTHATSSGTKPSPREPVGKCYVGGCSSQLCTDKQDEVSTCEYRASYSCYQKATCARQPSGNCGWTQTSALTTCLAGGTQTAVSFSGTISAVNTSCFSDGICSITIGGKEVIITTGMRINPPQVGSLKGVDSISDVEKKIGGQADVYAAPTTEGGADYTLYGSSTYYVLIK